MDTLTLEAAREIESSHHHAHPLRSVTEAARDRKVCALIMTGRSVQEVAEAFSISTRKVADILTEYQYDPAVQSIHHNLAAFARSQRTTAKATVTKAAPKKTSPATGAVKVNNDDIFSALREAMEATQAGPDLSQLEYDAWRAANKPDAPGTRTIRRRLGWQQAKELATSVRSTGGYSATVEALPVRVYQPEPVPIVAFEKVEENKSENVVDMYR